MKKYSEKRNSELKERKPLTKYERWIYELARHKFKLKPEILKLRNNLKPKQLEKLGLENNIIQRQALHNTIKKIEAKLDILNLFSKEKPHFVEKWTREEPYRLHAKSMTVKIKGTIDNKYVSIRNLKQNKDILDFNSIELHRNKLTIYSNKDFFGAEPNDTINKSELYWQDFLRQLEKKYGIIIFKNGAEIFEFRNHLAHIDHPLAHIELAKKKKGSNIKIYDKSGILRFEIDNSFNVFKELEAVHPQKYAQDMNRAHRELRDYADNPESMVASELTSGYKSLIESQDKLNSNLNAITLQLKKSAEISTINASQLNLLVKSQQAQALQIENLNNNMGILIEMLTPEEFEEEPEFKPTSEYLL